MAKKYESRAEMHLPVSQEMPQVGKRLIDTVWSETRIASENLTYAKNRSPCSASTNQR
jgi:hypothetical protein